jgi:hypothetical protein
MDRMDMLAQAVDADKVAPGTIGFLIIAALGAATWMLMRSMNKQLKKIDFPPPDSVEEPDDEEPRRPAEP